jgi:hypothetical protein
MIHTDGKQTIANATPKREDRNWLELLEEDLMQLDRLERERVYAACRENSTTTFEWLACLDGATSGS